MPSPPIPLRLRLANPPAAFLGRKAESKWLRASIRKCPVSVVWGGGGVGKSALVLHTLHASFPEQVARTIFIALRPAAPGEHLSSIVLAALAEAARIRIDGSGLADDPEALAAVAIDLAESRGWWVVLDDLHHADPSEALDLIANLARYGRTSRWIATSRSDPRREALAGHGLEVGSMPDAELGRLAKRLSPKGTRVEVRKAVAAACGSPWRLKQFLAAGSLGTETSWDALVRELPASVSELLRTLAPLEVPISRESLSAIGTPTTDREVAALERRGLVETTTAGLRLHDVVRGLLGRPQTDAPKTTEPSAKQLLALADPVAALEGARLMLALGRVDEVLSFVGARATELLATGHAPRLWRLVGPAPDERLAAIRLRCAVELGDPLILARVSEPPSPSAEDRLLWVRALLMRGEEEAAVEAAARLRADAEKEGNSAVAMEAGMLRTRVLTNLGRPDRALVELEAMRVSGSEATARREVRIAMCRVSLGEFTAAVRGADSLRARLPSLPPSSREEVGYGVAVVYHRAGRLREAAEVFDGVLANEQGESRALYFWRQSLFLRAVVAIQRGSLKEGGDALGRLQPLWGRSPALRLSASVADSIRKTAAGELEGLEESLEEAVREGTGIVRYAASVQLELLRMLRGVEPAASEALGTGLLALFRLRREIRFGRLPPAGLPVTDGIAHPEHQDAARIVAAEADLLAGKGAAALRGIAAAVEGAQEHGYFLGEVAACQLRCETLLVLDRTKELARASEELSRHAASMPSPRFGLEARFFLAASRESVDPAELEELAASFDMAPVAARRAQSLLGGTPRLDALDRQVLDAFRRRTGWRAPQRIGAAAPGTWQPGWGIDDARRRIWRHGAPPVPFDERPLLWKIVTSIAERNGSATKEDLVRDVWAVEEYHPLKHDNRLQLAIRKLRRAIETDPSRPELLVTTEGGYALAGAARRLKKA